ncbi:MAG: uracil-DNA glycosylase family protein, partial [Planctomycetota bacterium]
LRPKVLLCLGATAAGAIFGRHFRVTSDRGNPLQTPWCQQTIASWHPSALLRNPDDKRRDQQYDQLVRDLTLAKKLSEER